MLEEPAQPFRFRIAYPRSVCYTGRVKSRGARCAGALISALSLLVGSTVSAATFTVTNTNDGLAGSLRQAIQDAAAGDTITFNIPTTDPQYTAGTKTWTITLTSAPLIISRDVTIDGGGQKIVVQRSAVAGTPNFRVLDIRSGTVAISRITIANGFVQGSATDSDAGGIQNAGTLIITNCTVRGNFASSRGAGLFNTGAATVTNCTFTANSTNGGGGSAIYNSGSLTLTSCTISGNTTAAGTAPAGVYNVGTARVRNTVAAGNNSGGYADFVGTYISDGYNFVGRATGPSGVSGLGSNGFGGPGSHDQLGTYEAPADAKLQALADNGGPTLTMHPFAGSPLIDQGNSFGVNIDERGFRRPVDSALIANAGDGSDIGAVEFDQLQTGPNFLVTTADEHSDGFCGQGDCSLWDAANAANANADASIITFASDVSGTITTKIQASGIQLTQPVTIKGPGARVLTVSGAGVSRVFQIANGISANISGLTIANALTQTDGAGIFNAGQLTVSDCIFKNNNAFGSGAFGGGIASSTSTSLTVTNCSFFFNEANGRGGAISNAAGNLTVTNSTFNLNDAAVGGAVYSATGSTANIALLRNCTISGNRATTTSASTGGGGIFTGGSSKFQLANTIVAGNASGAAGPDALGTFQSQGNNIIGSTSGSTGFPATADQIGVDPRLGALADNGGNTDTMALAPGSPAIDKGNDANAPATDQRGFARFGPSDIGAYEVQAPPPTPTPTPTPAPSATPTPTAQLLNLSARKQVGVGDNVTIGGFIIVGTDAKKVILRGIGPSTGVNGALADPTLELHDASGTLRSNNDWQDTQRDEIVATGIPPSNSLESAIVQTLPAAPASQGGASYSGVLAGRAGGTGIGVLELYDLNTAANAKLANISTRGFVGGGDDVLIGGFIAGPGDRSTVKVLVRGLGPSIPVSGALQDPVLELHDSNGNTLVVNDNWQQASNAAEIQATLPPSDPREAAILATITPRDAGYTAILRGVNGTTGIGLVELYALP